MRETARYRVLRKIAHGGMAEIFLALQLGVEGFQKQVVLKRILPALAADPSFVRMLVDEAHIASTLNHSNLVQVLDLRHSGSEYFLVLEFVDGWSLEQVRRRAQKAKLKLPLPLALSIVGALCRALAYVHGRTRDGRPLGIVHRDVTPQNVLLSAEGDVKLADFGIAKALGKREKSATGVIKGKFAYMSPEQAAGETLDGRSDLFSVGTLLYLLTTGKEAVRRGHGPGRHHAGAQSPLREAVRVHEGLQPRRRAVHRARAAGEPEHALADGAADGGSHRRDPDQAGAADGADGAQAVAGDAVSA